MVIYEWSSCLNHVFTDQAGTHPLPGLRRFAHAKDVLTSTHTNELAEFLHTACIDLGLQLYANNTGNPAPVTTAINQVWDKFRENPDEFGVFEREILTALLDQIDVTI